jgi:hypothetical protein
MTKINAIFSVSVLFVSILTVACGGAVEDQDGWPVYTGCAEGVQNPDGSCEVPVTAEEDPVEAPAIINEPEPAEDPVESEPEPEPEPEPVFRLMISLNHTVGGFWVVNTYDEVVAEVVASDCHSQDDSYECEVMLPIGDYLVDYQDVPGFVTPEASFLVSVSEDKTLTGHYTPQSVGPTASLTISLDHIEGGFVIVNTDDEVVAEGDADECPLQANGYECDLLVPPGSYKLVAKDVAEFITPAPIHADVPPDGMIAWLNYQ